MEMSGDNIFHIFSLSHAKMICRSKSICKSFYLSLKEIPFQVKQVQNSLARDDPCFLIQPDAWQQPSSGVRNNVVRFLSKSDRVLSSSNGLILCCTTNKRPVELFVCNPATQSWWPIPVPEQLARKPNVDINMVLECCPGSLDDYLVFLFERPIDWAASYICKVYKAREGLWKTMERDFFAGGRSMEFGTPVHHNGALHFISDSLSYVARGSLYFKPYIMSYNLENGMSTMLRLPKEASEDSPDTRFTCNMGIFKWDKASCLTCSICLVKLRKSVFTVWLLKDYGSSSWQRVLKVRVKAIGLKEKDPNITGFTVVER